MRDYRNVLPKIRTEVTGDCLGLIKEAQRLGLTHAVYTAPEVPGDYLEQIKWLERIFHHDGIRAVIKNKHELHMTWGNEPDIN